MATHDTIVIGTSAGGVEALQNLVSGLPQDLPAAIFITLHTLPQGPSFLPDILSRAGPLPAEHPSDGAPIRPGRIYVAPPNRHLLIEPGRIHLSSGPTENRTRPAINPLFRSAAAAYGPRVAGVILTGNLDDGTSGLWEIKRRGGVAIVQDPHEALFPGMPESAIANVEVDFTVPLAAIPPLLTRLAAEPALAAKAEGATHMEGKPTNLTCPECRGPLSEFEAGQVREVRCRVGHAYGPASLLSAHAETVERILWAGVVALEEDREMARQFRGYTPASQHLAAKLRDIITEYSGAAASEKV